MVQYVVLEDCDSIRVLCAYAKRRMQRKHLRPISPVGKVSLGTQIENMSSTIKLVLAPDPPISINKGSIFETGTWPGPRHFGIRSPRLLVPVPATVLHASSIREYRHVSIFLDPKGLVAYAVAQRSAADVLNGDWQNNTSGKGIQTLFNMKGFLHLVSI